MPADYERTWQEVASSNRERIVTLEREVERARENVHTLQSEAAAVRFLAEKVADLATDVRNLAGRVEQVSRHAIAKPTATVLSVFGQYVGLAVALVALLVAVTR